jgi:transcriptional regulator with XRE-family HTH domain
MTKKPKSPDSSGFLSAILAMRLRSIENTFESYGAFAEHTGLSRATLYALRSGTSNPTFRTVEYLAACFNVSVYELLGVKEEYVRKSAPSLGYDLDELRATVANERKSRVRLDAFLGKAAGKKDRA